MIIRCVLSYRLLVQSFQSCLLDLLSHLTLARLFSLANQTKADGRCLHNDGHGGNYRVSDRHSER